MTFFLAWKNTRLHFQKRLPIGLFLVAAMALLFIGNSIFSNTEKGLEATYRDSLTGDLTISSKSDDPFTLFGSDLPLVGEYFKNPVLPRWDDIVYRLNRDLPGSSILPVLIGGGKISLGGFETTVPFFGAHLNEYFKFFPRLKVLRGSVPAPGVPGLFVNSVLYKRIVASLNREPEIGERFLFAAVLDSSFVLREVPFEGVFEYPVSDQLLDRVALVDPDTARALNGYYGSTAEVAEGSADLIASGSVDDLFSDSQDMTAVPKEGISVDKVAKELRQSTLAPVVDSGTWNFALVRQPADEPAAKVPLVQASMDRDRLSVQVRNWRDSAGGNAKIVWFLQWLFNLGLIFVSLVASLIVMNSLSLSVVERTKEIGTMRALGAPRHQVGRLIGYETVILVTGASLVGIALGATALAAVAAFGGVEISNQLIASLFGSHRYLPSVTWGLVVFHAVLGVFLGCLSMILPILRALGVAPVHAMARE